MSDTRWWNKGGVEAVLQNGDNTSNPTVAGRVRTAAWVHAAGHTGVTQNSARRRPAAGRRANARAAPNPAALHNHLSVDD